MAFLISAGLFSWWGSGGRFCKNMIDPNMLMYGRRWSTPLSPFICSIHLVDIVVLFIPDSGLVPGGMRSGKENERNRNANRLIFEGINSCINHSAIITRILLPIYFYFLLKMPCPHYFLKLFLCLKLLRVVEDPFNCDVLYLREKTCPEVTGNSKYKCLLRQKLA